MIFSIKYENMDNIHLWKVVGALHKPNDIFLYAKTLNGQVKIFFS